MFFTTPEVLPEATASNGATAANGGTGANGGTAANGGGAGGQRGQGGGDRGKPIESVLGLASGRGR